MKPCTSRVLLGSLLATFLLLGGLGCELIASVDRDKIYDGTGGTGGSPPADAGADTKPPDSGKDATPEVGEDASEDVTEDVTEDVAQEAADDADTDAADDAADDVDTDAADDADTDAADDAADDA